MADFGVNAENFATMSVAGTAESTALLATRPRWVRLNGQATLYMTSPSSYSQALLQSQCAWAAENNVKVLLILDYGPPKASWQTLEVDTGYRDETDVSHGAWRACRPPEGWWEAELEGYLDMIATASAEFSNPASSLHCSYMNEPRFVVKNPAGDTYLNNGSIDTLFHERGAVQVPVIKAEFPEIFLWSPTVWGSDVFEYIDHWAANASGDTSYASGFDGWCFNYYPSIQSRPDWGEGSLTRHMNVGLDAIVSAFRSSAFPWNDTPLACHEIGVTPDLAGLTGLGLPDIRNVRQWRGKLTRVIIENLMGNTELGQFFLYKYLDDVASFDEEKSASSEYGFFDTDGMVYSSYSEVALLGGSFPTEPPSGFTNFEGPWADDPSVTVTAPL
ncbi:MAG: hypothetical protein ABL949_17190 [Fimbriimonadaceae bacterium]